VISCYSFSVVFIAVIEAAVIRINVVDLQVGGIDQRVRYEEVPIVHNASVDIDVIELSVSGA